MGSIYYGDAFVRLRRLSGLTPRNFPENAKRAKGICTVELGNRFVLKPLDSGLYDEDALQRFADMVKSEHAAKIARERRQANSREALERQRTEAALMPPEADPETERVVRGLYLLQARLLEALAFNRQPDPETADLANRLAEWWSKRQAES